MKVGQERWLNDSHLWTYSCSATSPCSFYRPVAQGTPRFKQSRIGGHLYFQLSPLQVAVQKMGLHDRGILSYGLGPQTCSYNRDRHFGRPDQRCDCKCWSRLLRPRLCTLAWKPHAAKGRTMCSSLHFRPVASARSQISIWNLWDAANGDAL